MSVMRFYGCKGTGCISVDCCKGTGCICVDCCKGAGCISVDCCKGQVVSLLTVVVD